MTFYVGQKVVCIKKQWNSITAEEYAAGVRGPVFGQVYTVRGHRHDNRGYIRLVEIRNPCFDYRQGFLECCFRVDRFRPLIEREYDISIFTKMLTPKREPANV